MRRISSTVLSVTRRLAATAVAGVLAFGLLSACGGDITNPQPVFRIEKRDCTIDLTNLPSVRGRIDLDLPTKCPLSLPGPYTVFFSGMATLTYFSNSGYVPRGAIGDHWFDQGNNAIGGSAFPYWGDYPPTGFNGDTLAYVYERGSYLAGDSVNNCARNLQGQPCEDRQEITIQRSTPGPNGTYYATLVTHFPYQNGFPLNIKNAPASVDPGAAFELHAAVNTPVVVPPVSYAWTRDGQLVSTDTMYSDAASYSPNTSTDIGLVATDANGQQISSGTTIWTNAGCGGADQCGYRAGAVSGTGTSSRTGGGTPVTTARVAGRVPGRLGSVRKAG